MSGPSTDLPSFARPPVVEVALSAQFRALPNLGMAQLGSLWTQFKSRFPRTEQYAAIPHQMERIGIPRSRAVPELKFMTGIDMVSRLWLLNESGTELFQVQPDRFIRNWRCAPGAPNQYPRYEHHLRPEFLKDASAFMDFVASQNIGEIEFDQCEVTYVNHIRSDAVWRTHSDLAKVFRAWSPDYDANILADAESISVRTQHLIRDSVGEFVGRLYVELESAYLDNVGEGQAGEQSPAFVLQIVTRGRPLQSGLDGVMEFLDLGHTKIVSAFDRMTTPAMHKEWGKLE